MNDKWLKRKRRVFQIIEVGNDLDFTSRAYDFANALAIVLNLAVSIMYTFSHIQAQYGNWLILAEEITVAFFAVDYVLRLWTARFLYPGYREIRAVRKYALSFTESYK